MRATSDVYVTFVPAYMCGHSPRNSMLPVAPGFVIAASQGPMPCQGVGKSFTFDTRVRSQFKSSNDVSTD
eukprot:1304849-Pyramimonas_sp.AAC.1